MKDFRNAQWNWPTLLGFTALAMWAAHALAFFAHEYSHSFTAWLLGWKSNPLALNYAPPTLKVLLLQRGISENVDYDPIFANGHGAQAAIIAAAGMVVGNGIITYTLSRWACARASQLGSRAWAIFAYWLCVASVGNFIDYVPVRTFTSEGDMGTVQRGLNWSPWAVLLVLGIPTLLALLHFLLRIGPSTLRWLFPSSSARRIAVATLTSLALFWFYGGAGLSEGGPISHTMSLASIFAVFPLATVMEAALVRGSMSSSKTESLKPLP